MTLIGGCAGLGGGVPKDFRGGYESGDKVLVMLPASGPYGQVADAVREGVLAANGADDTGARPEVGFADSADAAKIGENYDKGVADGATQVIGPLQKRSVDTLAERGDLPVTTLALNKLTASASAPENLYQFSLAPENEATDVADKAEAQGMTRALMIYPDDRSGTRRADAFRRQWKIDDGVMVAEQSVNPAGADTAAAVSRLLAAGDADFVFLAADADQAMRIYPEIRKAAPELPVVAPGIVYSGNEDAARDRALAGLYFVDMPWMLGVGPDEEPLRREAVRDTAPYLSTPLGRRLYAMGIDAYRMAPRVARMAADPKASFPGRTGTLSVDPMGRIRRELALAQFTETGPKAVEEIGADAETTGESERAPRPEPATKG